LVTDPVVLEDLWSRGEFGRSHVRCPC
jgi:hypothetical protein